MIRHLGPTDYRTMPWANGRGQTVEILRVEDALGLIWRLSQAAVIEDGPFSRFPGIDRNLTVLTGPGFDLIGDGIALRADPLIPVAFSGDVDLTARGVTAPSSDFNLMTRRALPRPEVAIFGPGSLVPPEGGLVAGYALADATISGLSITSGDVVLSDEPLILTEGKILLCRLFPGDQPLQVPPPGL